jgi:hypothetical protein
MAKVATKKTVAKKTAVARSTTKRDHSPDWTGCESWDTDKFYNHFHSSMKYYNLEHNGKEMKPQVIKWMGTAGYDKETIAAFKKTKDWRSNTTMGALASCLLKGMQSQRADFNNGKDSTEWLKNAIANAIREGSKDIEDVVIEGEAKPVAFQPSIQDRLRETALRMTEEIEDAIESFNTDPENFDPKAFKVLNLLKGKDAKAAHARTIRDFYKRNLEELEELASGSADEQLREGYKHRSRKQVRALIDFYKEVDSACTMLMQEAKVNRAPRAKKAQPKEKIVAKLKYMKTFETLKLVSINPQDIIGSKEVWVYNTKSRKLGKYVAAAYQELNVKGASIINFSETDSICKTLRKPEEKLKEFKAAGKVALRKFLEDINATDTKMNGRLNEETIILKATS